MTVKELEFQIIGHARSLATSEESLRNLRVNYSELKAANAEVFSELKGLIAEEKAEAVDLKLCLAIAEKEIADLKALREHGRSFRSTLTVTFISAAVSAICSAAVAYYMRPK